MTRWRRIAGLVRKESLQALRDPASVLIAIVLPFVLLLLFGYGVTLDARRIPLAIVIEQPTSETYALAGAFAASDYFVAEVGFEQRPALARLAEGRVQGVLYLREDFARRLWTGAGAEAQLLVAGTDANSARLVGGYVQGAWEHWLSLAPQAKGIRLATPVRLEPRVWFNASVRSQDFLIPGLIAINMTLIGTLLTALVVAREWERGTLEALFASPVGVSEFLLAKLVPYLVLGLAAMALSTAIRVWLFGVPFRGSFLVLSGTTFLFLLGALGLGLLISTIARNQFVAGQIAILAAFLPAYMLSGFLFDIASMPPAVQAITHVVPARYFVAILQTVFLAGDVAAVIVPSALALALIAAILLGLTGWLTRKRLD